jgi:hypothetical protein
MTDAHPNGAMPPAQQALHAIAEGGGTTDALQALASSNVLLPDPGAPEGEAPGAEEEAIHLPVYEQEDGTKLVPVFTDEIRMTQALPGMPAYRVVPLALLGGNWPSDELSLAIDAGSPDTLTLAADGVRTLATLGST